VTRTTLPQRAAEDAQASTSQEPSVSVVVPVYRSAAMLAELVERLTAVLGSRAAPYEIVLVDDGSGDGSWRRIVSLAGRYEQVRGLELGRNYGQTQATLAGIREAEMEVIVTLDDDLQHPPEEIPRLLTVLLAGNDVAYGHPRRAHHPRWRVLGSSALRLAHRALTRDEIAGKVSSFRAFHTHLRDRFEDASDNRISIHALLRSATEAFGSVTVRHDRRRTGKSGYSTLTLFRRAAWRVLGAGPRRGRASGATSTPAYTVRSRTREEPCELLEWDTEFWGVRIARVRGDALDGPAAKRVDDWCREHGIECLYFLSSLDPRSTAAADDAGYSLVDVRVTFGITVADHAPRPVNEGPPGLSVAPARRDQWEALKEIARVSHGTTRFYFDPNFPDERCGELYEIWLEKQLNGAAKLVLVAELDGEPVGYSTVASATEPHTGLTAVSERVRGRGVGAALVMHRLNWLQEHGVEHFSIITQGRNIPAQRLYRHCGFEPEQHQLWFHKWYSRGALNGNGAGLRQLDDLERQAASLQESEAK
jgi:undecaprenyl-phosphate 4-deoxy-4-formamido-L-arabinose transferase